MLNFTEEDVNMESYYNEIHIIKLWEHFIHTDGYQFAISSTQIYPTLFKNPDDNNSLEMKL
jgi:hypothetical protein